MNRVEQTRFGRQGNCFQACVAMVTGLELDDVPDFGDDPKRFWWGRLLRWLNERDLTAVMVWAPDQQLHIGPWGPGAKVILGGVSPRDQTIMHSVVCYSTERDTLETVDPHPDQSGLAGAPRDAIFVLPFPKEAPCSE